MILHLQGLYENKKTGLPRFNMINMASPRRFCAIRQRLKRFFMVSMLLFILNVEATKKATTAAMPTTITH